MRVSYVTLTNSVVHEPVHYVVIVGGHFYRRLSGRGFSCVISGNRSFLYAFDAIAKDGDDACLGVLPPRSGWVEVGLPIGSRNDLARRPPPTKASPCSSNLKRTFTIS
jgi:hypothetical protein